MDVILIGNVVKDVEVRKSSSGNSFARVVIAKNTKSGEEEVAHYFDGIMFGELAENVAKSISKGSRVIVTGRLDTSKTDVRYEKDGDWVDGKFTKVNIVIDEIGPSLRWATADVTRTPKSGGDAVKAVSESEDF